MVMGWIQEGWIHTSQTGGQLDPQKGIYDQIFKIKKKPDVTTIKHCI